MQNIEALKAHLDPLKPFLDDDYVSEIILNRPQELFIERKGQFEKHVVEALDYNHLFRLVTLVANYNKKPFSDKVPRLSATLPQGYRLQALTPPVLEQGRFSLSIRKQVISDYTLDDYDANFYENLKINDENRLSNKSTAIDLIRSCILNRKTILISGGTSTGKTTFLNACLKEIPLNERLITLEDTREIHVEHPNHCSLMAGYNGEEYSDQDMIENLKATLRLRPDRILLGELRGGEATTFLEAASTGHEGSFSTIHASSAKLALERVCMLAERGGLRQQSREELREYVLSIIDVVIQLKRLPDGTRQMTEILYKDLDR